MPRRLSRARMWLARHNRLERLADDRDRVVVLLLRGRGRGRAQKRAKLVHGRRPAEVVAYLRRAVWLLRRNVWMF